MTLYLYRVGSTTPLLTLENVTSYTADSVVTEAEGVYGPFAVDVELSATPDCAGTLRAAYRVAHPDPAGDRDAMLVELEYRLTLLELGVN